MKQDYVEEDKFRPEVRRGFLTLEPLASDCNRRSNHGNSESRSNIFFQIHSS